MVLYLSVRIKMARVIIILRITITMITCICQLESLTFKLWLFILCVKLRRLLFQSEICVIGKWKLFYSDIVWWQDRKIPISLFPHIHIGLSENHGPIYIHIHCINTALLTWTLTPLYVSVKCIFFDLFD